MPEPSGPAPTTPTRGPSTKTRAATRPGARPSRAAARRQATVRRRNRRRGLVVVAVLIVAAAVGIVVQSNRSSSQRNNLVVSPAAKGPSGSMIEGSAKAPVLVEEYSDFQCPHCGDFFTTTNATITQLVNAGTIRFAVHLFAFIGPESFAEANTALAAADQGKFWQAYDYFFANQRSENSGYWTTQNLLAGLSRFGAATPPAEQIVRNQTYYPWLRQLADQASQRGVVATPTVYVNNTELTNLTPAGLTAAVNAAAHHL